MKSTAFQQMLPPIVTSANGTKRTPIMGREESGLCLQADITQTKRGAQYHRG